MVTIKGKKSSRFGNFHDAKQCYAKQYRILAEAGTKFGRKLNDKEPKSFEISAKGTNLVGKFDQTSKLMKIKEDMNGKDTKNIKK